MQALEAVMRARELLQTLTPLRRDCGGVCGAGEFLFAPLRERTTGKCFYKTHGKLIPAELGNDAGMIGAAMLHRDAQ